MISNGSALSERRKRGSGLSERTTVTLSPRSKKIILENKINLSALVDKFIVDKFGISEDDPVLAKMLLRMDDLQKKAKELDEELRIQAISISSRTSLNHEDRQAAQDIDLDSAAAQNAMFKKELLDAQKSGEKE